MILFGVGGVLLVWVLMIWVLVFFLMNCNVGGFNVFVVVVVLGIEEIIVVVVEFLVV